MKLILGGAAAFVVLAAACGGTQEYTVGTTTTTGSTDVPRATAIERMASERCTRELSCGNIGPSRAWVDVDTCRGSVRDDTNASLKTSTSSCGGVDYYDLAVCMNAIRNAQCTSGGLPRFAECDGAKICR
jgi:hypothetical protein